MEYINYSKKKRGQWAARCCWWCLLLAWKRGRSTLPGPFRAARNHPADVVLSHHLTSRKREKPHSCLLPQDAVSSHGSGDTPGEPREAPACETVAKLLSAPRPPPALRIPTLWGVTIAASPPWLVIVSGSRG